MNRDDKKVKVQNILESMHSAIVAFSGGVDSTLLLSLASEALCKHNLLAVTALSPFFPAQEANEAEFIAASLGIKHMMIHVFDLTDERLTMNPPDRCFICKDMFFQKLHELAGKTGFNYIIEGSNVDDLSDTRPGFRAIKKWGIRSPLLEAGFTKAEVRALAHERNLPNWNKPALSCLASRIPFGELITLERLNRIEAAENVLHALGFVQVRIRDHNELAKIELLPSDISRLFDTELRSLVVAKLKAIGYLYVTIDLEGYRTGAMNEVLLQQSISAPADAN